MSSTIWIDADPRSRHHGRRARWRGRAEEVRVRVTVGVLR